MRYERDILKNLSNDEYYKEVVDDMKKIFVNLINFIEENEEDIKSGKIDIQDELDKSVIKINELDEEKNVDIDTIGREELADEYYLVLDFYKIDIDLEKAIRMREW